MANAYCINDGCGIKFDPTEPETRDLATLKPFAMRYCPKHREPATPPVVFVNIPPAEDEDARILECGNCGRPNRLTRAEASAGKICEICQSNIIPAEEENEACDDYDGPEPQDAICNNCGFLHCDHEETRERITCDQCELLAINGICCHETGCPNMGARWDAENREWIKQRKCFDCGCTVDADDPCCSAPFEDDEPQEEEEEEDVLRSTVDTREIGQAVLSEARETLDRDNLTAFFEHGHWWISDTEDGAQWSVVDCETATGEEYFDFEQVTQGDED